MFFNICAIINPVLSLGVPGDEENILVQLRDTDLISRSMQEKIAVNAGLSLSVQQGASGRGHRGLKKDKLDKKDYYPDCPRVGEQGQSCKNPH